ncbi:MAG: lipopolysaccharide biosynthesis protein [Actinomycetia bacterium]|nr:lipopolysaccharide biosynthesis protein [Actinomycetes bacterium]
MGMPQEADSFEFAGYLGVLRRRWWVVLVLACVGIVAAGAYIAGSPKAYTAVATVNVTATGINQSQGGAVAGGRTSNAVNLDTESQIVKSSTVAAIAARNLHSPLTPTALLGNVSVAVPANSSILQISCQAKSPQQAVACANAFAAGYLQNRSATAAATTNSQLKTVRNQLSGLEKSTTRLTLQIRSLPLNSPQRASAQSQLQSDSSQLRSLANQAASLSAQAAASSGGSIISKATPPSTPSSPKKKIILPGGLLAGLLIGLIIAFAWDKRDTRIKDARNLGQFGEPTLLTVSGKELEREPLASPRSAAGLEFTELARSLTAGRVRDDQLLMVAGASPGPSVTVTAANLAVALARTHSAVILVCPAGQGTAELLGLPESRVLDVRGAAELAAGEVSLDELALQPAGFPGLRVLVLAADLHDLPPAQARRLAGQLRSSADYAVIQGPAEVTGPDSFALAEYCGAALLTVEISSTKRADIEDSIRRLTRLGTSVVGLAVLPRLRLPHGTSQSAGNAPTGSVRLRQAGTGAVPPAPAPAKDEQDNSATQALHVDVADGHSGN